jgi:hypothetical protein
LESHAGIPGTGLAYRTKHNKKGKKGAAKPEEEFTSGELKFLGSCFILLVGGILYYIF